MIDEPTIDADQAACENCLYWIPNGEGLGECRRRAPVASSASDRSNNYYWPYTKAHSWCGEHEEGA